MAKNFDPFTQRRKLPAFPSVFGPVASLRNDPARMKSGFTGAGGVNADYAARVAAFNKDLYQPSDTKPQRAELPMIAPLSLSAGSRGWQQPAGRAGLMAIANKYNGTTPEPLPPLYPGEQPIPFNTVSANPAVQPLPPFPDSTGTAGPAGDPGVAFPEVVRPTSGVTGASAGAAGLPEVVRSSNGASTNGEITPEAEAQRKRDLFIAEGGSQRTLNKALSASGIKPRIDARSNPSAQNSSASEAIRNKWGWGVDPMKLPY